MGGGCCFCFFLFFFFFFFIKVDHVPSAGTVVRRLVRDLAAHKTVKSSPSVHGALNMLMRDESWRKESGGLWGIIMGR